MRASLPILTLVLSLAAPARAAETASWRVSEAGGAVTLDHAGRAIAAARGMLLAPGDALRTGPSGRAVLVHGGDIVILSPATSFAVPREKAPEGFVEVIEAYGRALYQIEKQALPHFRVKTRLLAATVKGTVFTVDAADGGAAVAVTEGRVEVATADGHARELVTAGLTGAVDAAAPGRLEVRATAGAAVEVPARVIHAALLPSATATEMDSGESICRETSCGPRLAYADAADNDGAAAGDAPRLVYTIPVEGDDLSHIGAAVLAAPASLQAAIGRAGGDAAQLTVAIRSEMPAEQKLAGLVTISAPSRSAPPVAPPTPTAGAGDDQGGGGSPAPASKPAPAPAPAPTLIPPPTPKRSPPICLLRLVCL